MENTRSEKALDSLIYKKTVRHSILFVDLHSNSFKGHYNDSLSDAKVATDLQPSYVKAIVRGRI